MTEKKTLGIIGGSGIYQMPGVKVIKEHQISTPFGTPSDAVIEAELAGGTAYFIPRHGRGHRYTPSEVPYRANIYALKSLGVTHILAVSAVGIMRESITPGDMVVPDQIFDRTKGVRASTFFGDGVVGHIQFADPFCSQFRKVIGNAAHSCKAKVHEEGSYVCMEGPAFSTRAESNFYRKTLNPAVIGMTGIPEAKLAREAEMCYAMLALATDYDCWHETEEDVSVEAVMAVLKANATMANNIVKEIASTMSKSFGTDKSSCTCQSAAKFAIMTQRDLIPEHTKEKVRGLWGHYFE